MNRTTLTAAALVAASLLVPSGLATWGSYGSSEPDNSYDAHDGYMWTDAPGAETGHVYFNVYTAYALGQGNVAPNSASLGGRTGVIGPGTWQALLGVWADCNQDGYVGLADGALLEYRAEASAAAGFPVDTNLCPPVPDTPENAGAIHNNGGWITELIPIAPATDAAGGPVTSDMGNVTNYRLILDPAVKMWGDLRYEPKRLAAEPPTSDSCHQVSTLFGKGQTSHTGGMIQHVECLESLFLPTPHDVYEAGVANDPSGVVATLPDPHSLYADGGPADVGTFGTDQSCKTGPNGEAGGAEPCQYGSNSVVSGEQDCSSAPLVDLGAADPVYQVLFNGALQGSGPRAPGSVQTNPQGSVAATANETIEESALDDCNSGDDSGRDVYGIAEVDGPDSVKVTGKQSADMDFRFDGTLDSPQARGACSSQTAIQTANFLVGGLVGNLNEVDGDPAVVPAVACGAPSSLGVPADATLYSNDMWWAGAYYSDNHPPLPVDRNTLQASSDAFPADYYTFYASVGASGLRTPGGVGQYGAERCVNGVGRNAGVQYGWDCDPANWNLDPTTGAKQDDAARDGTVGDSYNLRDVECYDMTVVAGNAAFEGTSLNPTGRDIGARSVPLASQPGNGCA